MHTWEKLTASGKLTKVKLLQAPSELPKLLSVPSPSRPLSPPFLSPFPSSPSSVPAPMSTVPSPRMKPLSSPSALGWTPASSRSSSRSHLPASPQRAPGFLPVRGTLLPRPGEDSRLLATLCQLPLSAPGDPGASASDPRLFLPSPTPRSQQPLGSATLCQQEEDSMVPAGRGLPAPRQLPIPISLTPSLTTFSLSSSPPFNGAGIAPRRRAVGVLREQGNVKPSFLSSQAPISPFLPFPLSAAPGGRSSLSLRRGVGRQLTPAPAATDSGPSPCCFPHRFDSLLQRRPAPTFASVPCFG